MAYILIAALVAIAAIALLLRPRRARAAVSKTPVRTLGGEASRAVCDMADEFLGLGVHR